MLPLCAAVATLALGDDADVARPPPDSEDPHAATLSTEEARTAHMATAKGPPTTHHVSDICSQARMKYSVALQTGTMDPAMEQEVEKMLDHCEEEAKTATSPDVFNEKPKTKHMMSVIDAMTERHGMSDVCSKARVKYNVALQMGTMDSETKEQVEKMMKMCEEMALKGPTNADVMSQMLEMCEEMKSRVNHAKDENADGLMDTIIREHKDTIITKCAQIRAEYVAAVLDAGMEKLVSQMASNKKAKEDKSTVAVVLVICGLGVLLACGIWFSYCLTHFDTSHDSPKPNVEPPNVSGVGQQQAEQAKPEYIPVIEDQIELL